MKISFIVMMMLCLSACSAQQETQLETVGAQISYSELQVTTSTSVQEVNILTEQTMQATQPTQASQIISSELGYEIEGNEFRYLGNVYQIIEVDGGERSGTREAKVAVDIGFGEREYWALTNEHGQLVYVLAQEIKIQDDSSEVVNQDGRYYDDEANVPGTEAAELDQGHVIADSLGGVANAYNITPQDSVLNRHGQQAYMEKVIRDAQGCTDFVATITYSNEETQTPYNYRFEYILAGSPVVDEFLNINPDSLNTTEALVTTQTTTIQETTSQVAVTTVPVFVEDISLIDTNGNGKVTIAEAKAAGYSMPVYDDHWLYKYMDDRDHDGMVGE